MKDLKLNLSIDEVHILLKGLGNLPYMQVFSLIEKIQAQAREQLNQLNGNSNHDADQKSDVTVFNS